MIPIIIFLIVLIIGILVYFLVIKKKSSNNNLKNNDNKCNSNEVLINNMCQKKLGALECKSDSPDFMILDKNTKNTSCREMTTNEKIKHCEKNGLIYYKYKCRYQKKPEDCEKEDQFSKPDYVTENTTCIGMSENEKIEYCKKINKTYFENKCISAKTDDMCPKNRYQKPDPKTNFTTCTKMSEDEIKDICKQMKKIYSNGMCVSGVTEEECKSKVNLDEPLFYLKPNKDFTKCIPLITDDKIKICLSNGMKFDGIKCICPKNTFLLNGQCLGKKTNEQCFNKFKFSKPNKADLSSCTPMTGKEKEKYCQDKDMIYENNDCRKVLIKEDCDKEVVVDDMFKKTPDKLTNFTTCRQLLPSEKKVICEEKGKFWDGNDCLMKLGKPEITILKSDKNSHTFLIKVIGDIKLNELVVKHEIKDPCECKEEFKFAKKTVYGCGDHENDDNPWCFVKGKSKCGIATHSVMQDNWWKRCKIENIEGFSEKHKKKSIGNVYINKLNSENKTLIINVNGLSQNTTYEMKIKLLTNKFGLESPYSDFIEFKTICDSSIYTRSYCRNNNGPENTTISTVKESKKDRDVMNWPFFKVPDIKNGETCGCRELKKSEAKQLCINTYYPNFKDNNRKVMLVGNKCVPAPIPVGPPTNVIIKNLEINQYILNNNIVEYDNYNKFKIDKPFRVYLKWNMPKFFELEINKKTVPTKFEIFRRDIEYGENYKLVHTNKYDDTNNFDDFINSHFYYVDEIIKPGTIYQYKIVPINSVGKGPFIELSIKTKEKKLSHRYCEEKLEDPDTDVDFDGFKMKLDILNNKCISMSVIEKDQVCKNDVIKIAPGYENYYDTTTKKCKPFIPSNITILSPGKPKLQVISKTSTSIKLNIIPSKNLGMPLLTDYVLTWGVKNPTIMGRLTHNDNYDKINIAGSESVSTPVYIKPHSNGLDFGIELIHNNLIPAKKYMYILKAVSFNDGIWRNYSGSENKWLENNSFGGVSNFFIIHIVTDYSVPMAVPNINLGNNTHDSIDITIDKFPVGKDGGSKENPVVITKYKINRLILPKNKNLSLYFKSEMVGTEVIIDLNNLRKFNEDNTKKYSISFDNISKMYYFKDLSVEPNTNYRYYLYAMNDKLDTWSKEYKYLDVKTIDLPPFYECKNPTNLVIVEIISNDMVNRVDLNLNWDKSINPNIAKYKKFNIFTETKGYPKYSIIAKSENNRKEYEDIENNFITVKKLFIGTNYKIVLKVKHRGILNFSNGFKYLIETVNETNINDELHNIYPNERNINKPLTKTHITRSFTSDSDCQQNDLYYDNTIFNDSKKVQYYLNNDNPRKCVTRKGNPQKLTDYCQELNNNNKYVYWSSEKKCKKPKDGKWVKQNVFDAICTRSGLFGDHIVCGGGKKVKNKYVYKEPEYDNGVAYNFPELNGKDVKAPVNTTVYIENEKKVAYEFQDCGNDTCTTLCKEKYGQIQPEAIFKGKEIPLSLSDINDNTYCKKDTKLAAIINLPSETCPSCGNPYKEIIERTWSCIDGFAGKSKITKCSNQENKGLSELNIKGNVEEGKIAFQDRIEGKWYKCHGIVDTNGNTVPDENYKNVSVCNPPYLLQKSERKDKKGNNIVVKRYKYFMQKTKRCTEIPWCNWMKTKDRFPKFTNYCGSQIVSTNKICIGPKGDHVSFNSCDTYQDTGDYKLTSSNDLNSCKEMCEGPKNGKSRSSDGYDKWEDYSSKLEWRTEKQFNEYCKIRNKNNYIPKYTKNISVTGSECGGCGLRDKTRYVYDICEDGLFGDINHTSCKLNNKTKSLYNNINNSSRWAVTRFEDVDCDNKNHHCVKRRKHISNNYKKKCEPTKLCTWNIISKKECNAHCNGGIETQNLVCKDDNGNITDDRDCGGKTGNFWGSRVCNTTKCSKLCNGSGGLWTGKENIPYTKRQYIDNCLEVKRVKMLMNIDKSECKKGCGYRDFFKKHFCIDGYGIPNYDNEYKSCEDEIKKLSNDKSSNKHLEWVKTNKTNRVYEKSKDCFNNKESEYFENFGRCHDINDESTWDISNVYRDKWIVNEKVDCTGILGNNVNCEWKISNEVLLSDCKGTKLLNHKCVDPQVDHVAISSNRCAISQKPAHTEDGNKTCAYKKSKWSGSCDVCGIKENNYYIKREINCEREGGYVIDDDECKDQGFENKPTKSKLCSVTKDCRCICTGGKEINNYECNNKYAKKFYGKNFKIEDCRSCESGRTLVNYKTLSHICCNPNAPSATSNNIKCKFNVSNEARRKAINEEECEKAKGEWKLFKSEWKDDPNYDGWFTTKDSILFNMKEYMNNTLSATKCTKVQDWTAYVPPSYGDIFSPDICDQGYEYVTSGYWKYIEILDNGTSGFQEDNKGYKSRDDINKDIIQYGKDRMFTTGDTIQKIEIRDYSLKEVGYPCNSNTLSWSHEWLGDACYKDTPWNTEEVENLRPYGWHTPRGKKWNDYEYGPRFNVNTNIFGLKIIYSYAQMNPTAIKIEYTNKNGNLIKYKNGKIIAIPTPLIPTEIIDDTTIFFDNSFFAKEVFIKVRHSFSGWTAFKVKFLVKDETKKSIWGKGGDCSYKNVKKPVDAILSKTNTTNSNWSTCDKPCKISGGRVGHQYMTKTYNKQSRAQKYGGKSITALTGYNIQKTIYKNCNTNWCPIPHGKWRDGRIRCNHWGAYGTFDQNTGSGKSAYHAYVTDETKRCMGGMVNSYDRAKYCCFALMNGTKNDMYDCCDKINNTDIPKSGDYCDFHHTYQYLRGGIYFIRITDKCKTMDCSGDKCNGYGGGIYKRQNV